MACSLARYSATYDRSLPSQHTYLCFTIYALEFLVAVVVVSECVGFNIPPDT